jgi:hypothetical protein
MLRPVRLALRLPEHQGLIWAKMEASFQEPVEDVKANVSDLHALIDKYRLRRQKGETTASGESNHSGSSGQHTVKPLPKRTSPFKLKRITPEDSPSPQAVEDASPTPSGSSPLRRRVIPRKKNAQETSRSPSVEITDHSPRVMRNSTVSQRAVAHRMPSVPALATIPSGSNESSDGDQYEPSEEEESRFLKRRKITAASRSVPPPSPERAVGPATRSRTAAPRSKR